MNVQQWLDTPGLFRMVLVEADYLQDDQLKTLYLSNAPYRSAGTDNPAYMPFDDWIISDLEFSRRMTQALIGRTTASIAGIELQLTPEVELLLTGANFAGQQIRVLIGDKSWLKSDFLTLVTGLSNGIDALGVDRARISFRDKSAALERPVATNVFVTGHSAGKLKPVCLGRCFNVSPVLLDANTKTYQVHDGPISAITQVRENGVSIGYNADLAAGTFTLANAASGRITADVDGAKINGQWLKTAIDFAKYLTGETTISGDLPDYLLGLYVSDNKSVIRALDDVVSSVGGGWHYNRQGRLVIHRFDGVGSSSALVTADDIEFSSLVLKIRLPPLRSISLGYRKNWTIQADGLAGVVTEQNPLLALQSSESESKAVATNDVLTNYPAAASIEVSTLIVNAVDAATEVNRRVVLSAEPHAIYEMQAFASPLAFNLADSVTVTYPQYFVAGANALVVGIVDQPIDGTAILEVWQ